MEEWFACVLCFYSDCFSRFLLEWYRLNTTSPSNQVLLRRFQIAKALPRLLRYLLPLWRGRVLRNDGDENLVNDFLLWAVYTHCYDVLPTQRCWLVESEGEVLKSSEKLFLRVSKWLEEHPTNLLFSSSCSQSSLWQTFPLELCFRVHKKQHWSDLTREAWD